MTTDQWIEAVAPLFRQVHIRDRRKRVVPRLSILDRRMASRVRESAAPVVQGTELRSHTL
jgi:hypothetical protein